MSMEHYSLDPFNEVVDEPTRLVTAVFSHPLHGRLIERLILWVRPYIDMRGRRYKLTWWGDGVAYYRPVSG